MSLGGLGLNDLNTLGSNGTCFRYDDALQQSVCKAENLNITDPPSIYGFTDYPLLWSQTLCYLLNVTLEHRVHLPGAMNYCTVPLRGYDAFLFAAIALIAACLLFGKLSAVCVLIAGAILGILHYYVNMLQLSNSITQWLSFSPSDLFLYAFLPPLVVEDAINIEFYMFRRMFIHSIMLAFVMVILTAIILTPLILFVLRFQYRGWSWVHGALFAAIIAPTDSLSVSSILKRANGPVLLTAILEGEALLNDAAGTTLFQVFEGILNSQAVEYANAIPTVWSVIPTIIVDIIKLSGIGVGIGFGFSFLSLFILRWIRWRGAGLYIEAVYILGMAYLTYYVTSATAGGSGVIAVVTFGLFGNWMSMWGMTGSTSKMRDFKAIWEAISFAANGLVFFWAGVAAITYVIRTISQIPTDAMTYVSIPLIYFFMLFIRMSCIAIFNPIFRLAGKALSVAEITFTGWSGLRGAVSLILMSSLAGGKNFFNIVDDEVTVSESYAIQMRAIKADMTLWTAWFVVLTLLVNGPCIAPLLAILKLNVVPEAARRLQHTAKTLILENTMNTIEKLQNGDEEDELLSGADWNVIAECVDLSKDLHNFGKLEAHAEPADNLQGNNDSTSIDLDQNSLWSVILILCRAIWQAVVPFLKGIISIGFCCPGSRDSSSQGLREDSSGVSWASLDRSSTAMAAMLRECPFQRADIFDSKVSVTTPQSSSDIETGSAKDEQQHKSCSNLQFSHGHVNANESEFDQVFLGGLRNDDPLKKFGETRMEESKTEGIDVQPESASIIQSDFPETFEDPQVERLSHQTRGNKSGEGEFSPADEHPQYDELVNYSSGLDSSFGGKSKHSVDSSRCSTGQRNLNSIPGNQLLEHKAQKIAECIAPDSGKVDFLDRELVPSGSDLHSTAGQRVQESEGGTSNSTCNSLKSNAQGANGNGYTDLISTLTSTSDIPARLRTISDFSNISKSGKDEESGTSGEECHRASHMTMRQDGMIQGLRLNTSQEIICRITEGLKTRFHENRGKISVEAFRILVGACDEKIESLDTKFGLWDILSTKISGSLITKAIAQMSLKSSICFNSANPLLKKVFHYPYLLSSTLCRKYLDRKVLLACEVAIEYNMALKSSSHLNWVRHQGEYVLPLLEEVEIESQRSYNFIIDRDIEAPDTFRAIQSYRGAIIVMKKMQDFVHEIHAEGIINERECQFVHEKVAKRLQRLELIGPIWRPPRYKDSMRMFKPFSTLKKDVFKRLWEKGTVAECKPGEMLFHADNVSSDDRQGIIYILNGMVKRHRVLNSVESVKFCGPGSCFGLLQALHLSFLRGTESLVAVGNTLGTGPAIFRISQEDVDEMLLRGENESNAFTHLMQGWIKTASLQVFEDLESPITLEIVKYMESDNMGYLMAKNPSRLKSLFAEHLMQANALDLHETSGRLQRIFSKDFIGVDSSLLETNKASEECLNSERASTCVQNMTQRLKRDLDQAKVLHFQQGASLHQDCTMILMLGHLKTDLNSQGEERSLSRERSLRAPAAIPWITEVDDQLFLGEAPEPSSRTQPITWTVISPRALVVSYPRS